MLAANINQGDGSLIALMMVAENTSEASVNQTTRLHGATTQKTAIFTVWVNCERRGKRRILFRDVNHSCSFVRFKAV
jgi:hypothetical protein